MRLRALVALVTVLSIAPAVAALAEDQPAVTAAQTTETVASQTTPPAPAQTEQAPPAQTDPTSTPAQPDPASSPAPKLEVGLAADEDGARVIVEVAAPAQAAPVAGEAQALPGADVVLQPPDTSFIVVQGTGDSLTELAKDPRVVSIRRDRTYSPTSLASGLTLIGADRAHTEGADGRGRTIAIIDTGIDGGHPALGGKVVKEACFSVTGDGAKSLCPNGQETDDSADARTPACQQDQGNLCEHGTHVAGIAHAVAPGADIVAIQVFSRVDDCPEGGGTCITAYESSLLLALDYVAELKDTVPGLVAVNLSLGGGLYGGACDAESEVQGMKQRIDVLRAKGVSAVAAAGNEGYLGAGAPGCISGAVTVGATDDTDRVADWSNYGSVLDLFAPGVEIDSSVPGGGTRVYSGTSMSTPHVTGALAVLSQKASETGAGTAAGTAADALVGRLTAAGRPIVYDGVTTPRLDLYGALTGASPSPAVTQTPDPDESEPGDPGDDSSDDPDDPSPSPQPGSLPPPSGPTQAPVPVPLPTVTVTVTVTAPPAPPATSPSPAAPAAQAAMCVRGKSKKTLSAARWAVEVGPGRGTLPDATLRCYLGMVGKASRVFSELTGVSTLTTAQRVLKPAKKTKRAKFESELLAAWLNWANGGVNFTAGVGGTATVKDALTTAEDRRLRGAFPSASISLLRKQVNARRTA
ncbi:S8 family serine peptidase [Streptosporangium sp. NPDC051023]|uniref:S8 family peptidase n=1 Tax=Streptosporangium sp. NPDC051023 TaxID=3155410 RepID=UPI00344C6807